MMLGNLQKGSLDIIGAVVELAMSDRPGLEWILRIQNPSMCSVFEAAAPSKDMAVEWVQKIHETGQNASVRVKYRVTKIIFLAYPYHMSLLNVFLMFRRINTRKWKGLGG